MIKTLVIVYGIPALIAGATIELTLPLYTIKKNNTVKITTNFQVKYCNYLKSKLNKDFFEKFDHCLLRTYHSSEQAKGPRMRSSNSTILHPLKKLRNFRIFSSDY